MLTKAQLHALYRYRCAQARDDFLLYRRLINPKLKVNWFVVDISQHLQNFALALERGEKPKLVIQAPPQHGKSDAISDIISWIAGRNPHLKTIFASFSERLGVRANLKLQRLYTRQIYKDIFPDTAISEKNVVTGTYFLRNREILEYVDNEGCFRNTTVQGAITGESLDLGVIDDPIKGREAANSETVRNKTWEWFTDDFFTRFSEDAGFLMILTRWHTDDPAGRLIEAGGIEVVTYKAIAEHDEEHRRKGEALLPEHKSIDFLMERKKIMGENFEALYQQNPLVRGGNMLKKDWIRYVSRKAVEQVKFDRYFITVDTALKNKERNDYTVYSAFGVSEGRLFYLDMFRGKPLSKERELTLKGFYKKNSLYPFGGCYIEQKASGIDLFQRLKEERYIVKEVERNTDKVFRAENASPYLEVYGLYVLEDLPNLSDFIAEYEQFPASKNDDIVDTIIDAVEIAHINKPTYTLANL